jgi:hypothetical protein
MISELKRSWGELKKGQPGHRFQERAKRNRNKRSSQSGIARWAKLTAGILLLLIGVVLCLIPGPGLPLILVGAALLAERSLTIARGLDWAELKIRKIIRWAKGWWRQAPRPARAAALTLAAVLIATVGYGTYSLTIGR